MTTSKDQERLEEALAAEALRLSPALIEEKVKPWIVHAVADVLAAKATSAGPTRKGEHVQVRFRVGDKTFSSSHSLSALRDEALDWFPKDKIVSVISGVVFGTVVRSDDIEDSLKDALASDLLVFLLKRPDLTGPLAGGQHRQKVGFVPEANRAAHDSVSSLKIRLRVIQSDGVAGRISTLAEDAADLIVKVPYVRFLDSGRKLGHVTARKALLKAMTKAMNAGLSDADIDSVKNEALVHHVMS